MTVRLDLDDQDVTLLRAALIHFTCLCTASATAARFDGDPERESWHRARHDRADDLIKQLDELAACASAESAPAGTDTPAGTSDYADALHERHAALHDIYAHTHTQDVPCIGCGNASCTCDESKWAEGPDPDAPPDEDPIRAGERAYEKWIGRS